MGQQCRRPVHQRIEAECRQRYIQAAQQRLLHCPGCRDCGTPGPKESESDIRGKTSKGDKIKTNYVISNASPTLTYSKLIYPQSEVPEKAFKEINARIHGLTGFVVYAGLDKSAEELGLHDYGYFIMYNMETEGIYDSWMYLVPGYYNLKNVSFPKEEKKERIILIIFVVIFFAFWFFLFTYIFFSGEKRISDPIGIITLFLVLFMWIFGVFFIFRFGSEKKIRKILERNNILCDN